MSKSASILRVLLAVSVFSLTCLSASDKDKANETVKAKWQALILEIDRTLKSHPDSYPCPGNRMNVGVIDAADFAGTSFALINFCPGGAYTDWIVAMRLADGKPTRARFRKNHREVDMGFARGASVMHGKDAELVPEKKAIYDISWDTNPDGTQLANCVVDAYVWNVNSATFDWDFKLTKEATTSYCPALEKQLIPH